MKNKHREVKKMRAKKIVSVLSISAVLLGGATTAFAASGGLRESISAEKSNIKTSIANLKAEQGIVKNALVNKKSEVGFAKVDKTAVTPTLQDLKGLKEDIKNLNIQLKAAVEAKDTETAASLKAQIAAKKEEVNKALETLAPYKQQAQKNKELRAELAPLKGQIQDFRQQAVDLRSQNQALRADIKALKGELKTAIQSKDKTKATDLANQITSKLNTINENLTKIADLKQNAAGAVDNFKL
jgi:chromosome segregation ATPase